jgi:hypothetical protein
VSEEKHVRHFVTNHRNQPVELHLPSGVIVLGPREEVEIQEVDLATPQLEVLRQNRLITTRAVVETPPVTAPERKRRKTRKRGR